MWFMNKLAGDRVTEIAERVGRTQPTISIGIADLKKRLPGRWSLVFVQGKQNGNRVREELFPLEDFRVLGREPLIRWLARWGMSEGDISELVNYPIGEVHGILRQ